MNEVRRPGAPIGMSAEQRIRVGQLIKAGHSNDLVVAQHAGVTPEQVAALRRESPPHPPAGRNKPR